MEGYEYGEGSREYGEKGFMQNRESGRDLAAEKADADQVESRAMPPPRETAGYRGFRDLKVYQLSYQLAREVFEASKGFPSVERYSLTDQLRRSSRSVAGQIAEAWRHRGYRPWFISKLSGAHGEASETGV